MEKKRVSLELVTQHPLHPLQVTVIGDGRCDTLTLAGDKLWDSDTIVRVGGEVPLPAAISVTNKVLSKKIFE